MYLNYRKTKQSKINNMMNMSVIGMETPINTSVKTSPISKGDRKVLTIQNSVMLMHKFGLSPAFGRRFPIINEIIIIHL